MSTSAITFDLDESIANAYLTLLRQQNKKVKLLLLKGLQEELDGSVQKEEVSDIKWFSKEDILKRINNNYDGITEKVGPWNFLKKYYEKLEKYDR